MTKQNWSAYPQLKMQTKLLLSMEERLQKKVIMHLSSKKKGHIII